MGFWPVMLLIRMKKLVKEEFCFLLGGKQGIIKQDQGYKDKEIKN